MPDIILNIERCARCGKYHEQLKFKQFTIPVDTDNLSGEFTHFAICPMNGEPILMFVFEDGEPIERSRS